MDVLQRIDKIVKDNPIVIFMKGTPQLPQCGFSMRAAQALQACGKEFAHVNVLMDPEIFENLPRYQNWPTFPQVFVGGELNGGRGSCHKLRGAGVELIQNPVVETLGTGEFDADTAAKFHL